MNTRLAGLLCLCLLFCTPTFSRDISKISSKNGVIILKSGKKFSGELHFFYKSDLVQVKIKQNQSRAFTAHQVAKFRFYDENFNTDRVFISVDTRNTSKNSHIKSGFYELISWGEIEVIGKLKYEDKSVIELYKNPRLQSNKAFVPKLISHEYFVYFGNTIQSLNNFRKNYFSEMRNEYDEINQFIKKESLNINDIYDQLQIIAYFNKMVMPEFYNMIDFAE